MSADLQRIDGADDPRLGDYRALTDPQLRKRYEGQAGVFIAEGPNPVRELVASRYPVRSVLLAEGRVAESRDVLNAIDAPAYVATREVVDETVRFPLHQGVIACGGRLEHPAVADVLDGLGDGPRLVAVLEGLNDHENLGVLFRSARALGADAVVVGPRCADPLYRRCVRVSMGHVLHVPWTWERDLDALFGALARAGFTTAALATSPGAVDVDRFARRRPDRVALLLGAEGVGLTDEALAAADARVRIPMRPEVDSLNVATAASIAFHALGAVAPG